MKIAYKPPGPVAKEFMQSDAFVRGIRGPLGSGKSVACCVELMRWALSMPKLADGTRKSRWAVIRNTQGELRTTTIKTWLDWFPEHAFGKFNFQPPFTHRIRKGDVDMEVIFIALDKEDDVKKLLSLELTGAWINEAREVPKAVLDMLTGRVGRYPSTKDLGGQTYRSGIIMDTNAMEPDHWWPIIAGDTPIPEDMDPAEALMMQRPEGWEFFRQPEAVRPIADGERIVGYEVNPEAENLVNLKAGYYDNQIQGKRTSWINVYLRNQLGFVLDGTVVYPTFSEERHVSRETLQPIRGHVIGVGIDFGLTPAAVLGQNVGGRFRVLGELTTQNMGAERFCQPLKALCSRPQFNGFDFAFFGDPAGDQRAQTDENTPFRILQANGIPVVAAPTNDFVERQGAVESLLNSRIGDIEGFMLDKSCTVLRAGFARGYHYPMINGVGGKRPADAPMKNRFSHPHDALQYLALGLGAGRMLMKRANVSMVGNVTTSTKNTGNVLERLTRRMHGRVS